MNLRRLILLGVLATALIACLGAAADCTPAGACGLVLGQVGSWWPASLGPVLLLGVWVAAAWVLKLGITLTRVSLELRKLPRVEIAAELSRTARVVGIKRVACVQASSATAFCAGFVRPTVFVSDSAIAGLSGAELTAVLHHEADHARRFEPLRRVARDAAADVLPFLPIVKWWSEQRIERCELEADAVAERLAGRSALAGALLVMSAPARPLAAFAGQTDLRARRLLGVEIKAPRPPRRVLVATFLYGWLALAIAGCMFEAAIALT